MRERGYFAGGRREGDARTVKSVSGKRAGIRVRLRRWAVEEIDRKTMYARWTCA